MITRADIAAHLERSVRAGFLAGRQLYTPLRTPFCREVPSDGAFETYADMGMQPWPVQNAGIAGSGGTDARTGAPVVNKMTVGNQITVFGGAEKSQIVYNLDWEVAIGIYHNAIDDDQAGDLEGWARDAALSFEKHMDFLAFDALNSGEATTSYGAGYDGLSFFNDSHFDKNAEYQTVQDNKYALTLSLDNFETLKVAAAKFKDDRGKPIGFNHNLLIVPPDLERIAAQICNNREDYGTTDRKMNPYAGSVRYIVAPGAWLDTTAWVLIDPNQVQKPLNLQIRKRPEPIIWDDNNAAGGGVRYFKFHARYAMWYGNWRLAALGNT